MSTLEWAVQAALFLLLLAALPFALRLERGLAALRRDRAGLEEGARTIEAATRDAAATLAGLRLALETGARQAAAGDQLRDDLRYLSDRAEGLADRLEALVRQARPVAPASRAAPLAAAPAAAPPPTAPSEAERELLQALRMAR